MLHVIALSFDSGHDRVVILFVGLVYFVFFRPSLKVCVHTTLRVGLLTTTIVTAKSNSIWTVTHVLLFWLCNSRTELSSYSHANSRTEDTVTLDVHIQ